MVFAGLSGLQQAADWLAGVLRTGEVSAKLSNAAIYNLARCLGSCRDQVRNVSLVLLNAFDPNELLDRAEFDEARHQLMVAKQSTSLIVSYVVKPASRFALTNFIGAQTMTKLAQDAQRLARALVELSVKVVFAESCTGGLIAASLARVPGISDWLCGSAVTYRSETKHQWLDVSDENLVRPGAVSAIVAREMANGVLAITPEADWSASITGHLGPDAPRRLDGVVYIGIARRQQVAMQVGAERHVLAADTRVSRQREAAALVMRQLLAAIQAA